MVLPSLTSMRKLKPHQQDLLDQLVAGGGLPIEQVDGRVLRSLRTLGLAEISGSRVQATAAGRRQSAGRSGRPPAQSRLNEKQEELLRSLLRRGQAPAEDLDGRITRPLVARGLVTLKDHIVIPTSAGLEYFDETRPTGLKRGRKPKENARATVIRRAVRQLESAIPPDAEVLVGNIMAAADDLVEAFRRHAGKVERGRSG
jgi:hypothetical protein